MQFILFIIKFEKASARIARLKKCMDYRLVMTFKIMWSRMFDDSQRVEYVKQDSLNDLAMCPICLLRRDLNQLEWLLINSNELTSLDGELPSSGHNLKMLYAVDNRLTHLPAEFRYLHRLETLFLQHNKIRNLNGTLQKARRLKFLELSYNELQEVFDHTKFFLNFVLNRI